MANDRVCVLSAYCNSFLMPGTFKHIVSHITKQIKGGNVDMFSC